MKDLSITKSIVPLEDINLALSAATLYQTYIHTSNDSEFCTVQRKTLAVFEIRILRMKYLDYGEI